MTDDSNAQSRRDVLEIAGAAAVAALWIPAASAAEQAAGASKIRTVGLMSPGDMGQAVAIQLKAEGFTVLTALEHRSERTRALAREAGLVDVGSLTHLIEQSDIVLSIIDPGAALSLAHELADVLRATGRKTLIVDCNAIAPQTAHAIAEIVNGAGGRFLDGGIIGPPPRNGAKTNIFISGPGAADFRQLAGPQLIVNVMGDGSAEACSLKMCYGAITKGVQAVVLEAMVAAERLGVAETLGQQLQHSGAPAAWALGQFPALPPKACRWVPEMMEISKTFGATGQTPLLFQGAADVYRFVAATPLGKETPETREKARQGRDVVELLAQARG